MILGILAGVETEYGLSVEGRGAEDQVDDARALVRSYPGECLASWNYRYESPRADLRGFVLERLSIDPEDAKFDAGKTFDRMEDVRSDRILPNGARLYNDHGHPEYATPECLGLRELALHDKAGELAVLLAARAMESATGRSVRLYKNNTDFHGASYGTHESYLAPRQLGFERLYRALTPMLVARQILTGAGKVGNETGARCAYQLTQRADFFAEPANADTLYRRPVFNTRDEPHASAADWIRVHVISGDANMIPSATARKVGLVKLAVALAAVGEAPPWEVSDPVRAFQSISRDESHAFRVDLGGSNWTTAGDMLESYFSAAERFLDLDPESIGLIAECRTLLAMLPERGPEFDRKVDWSAKRTMLEEFAAAEGIAWGDPSLRSFDLEYHRVDPDESLYPALEAEGRVEPGPEISDLLSRLEGHGEPTRARARGLAVGRFRDHVATGCWRSVTFRRGDELVEVELLPDAVYPPQLADAPDVDSFIEQLRGVHERR
jgi:Pup amidohydrolase